MRNRLVVVNSAVVERLSSRCPEDIQQLSSELASLAQNHCLLINQSSLETWGAWEVCVTHAHLTHRLKWVCAEKKSIQIYFSYNLLAGNQKKKKRKKPSKNMQHLPGLRPKPNLLTSQQMSKCSKPYHPLRRPASQSDGQSCISSLFISTKARCLWAWMY